VFYLKVLCSIAKSKVVLVLKHLIYRVLSVQPSIPSDALSFIAVNLRFGHVRRTP
jgi:hypothetical protein